MESNRKRMVFFDNTLMIIVSVTQSGQSCGLQLEPLWGNS